MKNDGWKMKDRAISERAEAYGIAWNSATQGTFNAGRNAAKRERRAARFGSVWVNPRAMAARPTKPVAPAENRRRRAMTAKARAARKVHEGSGS